MIDLLLFVKEFCPRRMLSVLALLACFSTAALGANDITGSVRIRATANQLRAMR